MSTSMVSTILEIEREAEALLAKAEQEAQGLLADAKAKRENAGKQAELDVKKEIVELENAAAVDRAGKVKDLTAKGEAALTAVKNVSDAAFDAGVGYVMKALAEK